MTLPGVPDTARPPVAAAGAPGAEPLDTFLAELAGASTFGSASRRLTDTLARLSGARCVAFYALDEHDASLVRTAETVASDGAPWSASMPPRWERGAEAAEPLFASIASLYALAARDGIADAALGPGAIVVLPLPQPQAIWSETLVDGETALARAGGGWRVLGLRHGERRRRIGVAPLGVAVLRLRSDGADPMATVEALLPLVTAAGPILGRVLAVEQYREAATRLDRQRDLLSAIIDALPDPVLLTTPGATTPSDGRIAQNRRAARLFDAADGDAAARRTVLEENARCLSAALASTEVAGEPRELRLVDPDGGAQLTFELGDHALREGHGETRLLVLRDVTALRRAGAQLERQVERARAAERGATRERDRLDLILDYVADPIVVTDPAGAILQGNRQAERLFPPPADAAGDDAASAARRRENQQRFASLIANGASEGSRRARLTLTHPATGNPLPLEVATGLVADPAGGEPVIVSVLHDLTTQVENERLYEELKRFSAVLEARVRAATADLEEQNARLQWQSEELERANRLKSEFLASMSHELRTPINALIGYSALLRDRVYGDLTPKQEDGLRRIHASAEQLLALINDILDLARIEAGRMPVHLERVALAPVLRESVQQAEPLARAKRLEFVLDVPREPVVVNTDPEKLKQVLVNLLSNAVKFTSTGRVALRATVDGGRVRLAVSDTGIGIAPPDLAAIWEDFRQLDQSRTREYGGTGLGLSIVRKLAERLGATVHVESTLGTGSTFTVEIPAADDEGA